MLRQRYLIWATIIALVANDLPLQLASAGDWPFRGFRRRRGPETAVSQLAEQIDELERHIDTYGTVVAKSPDVWGEARLTKYRVEYEKVMGAEASKFEATINAAISRSDQAFLLNAMSLQAAVSGNAPVGGAPAAPLERSVSRTETTFVEQNGQLLLDATGNPIPSGTENFETSAPAAPPPPASVAVPSGPTFAELTARPDFAATKVLREQELVGFGSGSIALEPTIKLDQMSRYLNHLHELRRISDGDDKSDAPGYALHLVRIPISVLPGEETREGYGAEVTVIARPNLHDELLPTTFRGLVINDLVDQMSFPLAKFLDSKESKKILDGLDERIRLEPHRGQLREDAITFHRAQARFLKATCDRIPDWVSLKSALNDVRAIVCRLAKLKLLDPKFAISVVDVIDAASADFLVVEPLSSPYSIVASEISGVIAAPESLRAETGKELPGAVNELADELQNVLAASGLPDGLTSEFNSTWNSEIAKSVTDAQIPVEQQLRKAMQLQEITQHVWERAYAPAVDAIQEMNDRFAGVADAFRDLEDVFKSLGIEVPDVAVSPSRRSQQPFPPSHLIDVYGDLGFLIVAKLASALKNDEANAKHTLLLDMQKFLAEEFHAAYEFLNRYPTLWGQCQKSVFNAVRSDDKTAIRDLRNNFIDSVPEPLRKEHTAAMAWMIIVESALLNERLKEDIHDLASAKNAYNLNVTNLEWMNFAGPADQLTPDAKQLFNDYVRCRWPIHVVALDPVTQDQNVADSFSQRREMQLALALGFASGQVSASNFTRMARRQELDMETIALNRTAVGFSHGDDTFGWRFYPRIQSPDTGGHLQTYAIDMFKGLSRDRILKESRLEPGIREVTAILIMPSFVPYVIFDVRSNWFELTDPTEKVMTATDSMALSAQITSVRRLSTQCARDAHLYRDGDVHRLLRAVDQLDRRLPLQTSYVQMPFDNTLGGFEFFHTGTPDLAPELKGFYGEAGIRVKAASASKASSAAANAAALIAATATATATASTPVNISINGTPAAAAPAAATSAAAAAATAKTTIFLVGDHFSVHETRVIAGNKPIQGADMRLLSRQVMEISIPETVTVVKSGDRKFVDVHVATPYGLSNHLLIPVVDETNAAAAVAKHEAERHFDRFEWAPAEIEGCFSTVNNDGTVELTPRGTPALKFARQNDLPGFQPTNVDVAFWVYVIDKAGTKTKAKRPIRPLTMGRFNQRGVVSINAEELADEIERVLNAEADRRPQSIASIELEGFVRCREGDNDLPTDMLPIVEIGNSIIIKIVPCESCEYFPQFEVEEAPPRPLLY